MAAFLDENHPNRDKAAFDADAVQTAAMLDNAPKTGDGVTGRWRYLNPGGI